MRRTLLLPVVAVLAVGFGAAVLLARSCDTSGGSARPEPSPGALAIDSTDAPERRRVRVSEPSPPSADGDQAAAPDGDRAAITVVVTGPDGGPVTAAVAAFVPEGNADEMPQAELDATGRAVLRPRVGTTGSVAVVARDLTSWESGALVAPAEGCVIEVSLGAGLAVEGVVVARDGVTAVPDAPVAVAAYPSDRTLERLARGLGVRTVTTDADGRFRVDGLRAGSVRLDAHLPPARSELGERGQAVVEAGASDARVLLWRTKSVQLVPVDVATGLAPRCVSLELLEVDEHGERGRYRQTTTRDAPAGAPAAIPRRPIQVSGHRVRRFRVRAVGYAPSEVVEVDPNAGPAVEEIRVELTPDAGSIATLRLHVETEDGDVPTFVQVTRWSADRRSSSGWQRRTSDGSIELELAPGPAALSIAGSGAGGTGVLESWLSVELELDVPSGALLDQRVVLPVGGRVRVAGAPAGTVRIADVFVIAATGATELEVLWDREEDVGMRSLLSSPLPPGDYEMRWRFDGRQPLSFTVRAREVTEIRWPTE